MNIENVDKAIQMMYRVKEMPQRFDMRHFQSNTSRIAYKEANLECETACCFSGWLAISEEFEDYPDKKDDTVFSFGDGDLCKRYEYAVAELLGISFSLADVIIFPEITHKRWVEVWGKYNFNVSEDEDFYDWEDIKPEHLIDVLERVKSGELE